MSNTSNTSNFDKAPPPEYTPVDTEINDEAPKTQISPAKLACLGAAWAFVLTFWVAMILPPAIIAIVSQPTCQTSVVPIEVWLLVRSGLWFFAALFSIGPFYVLTNGRLGKRGCLVAVNAGMFYVLHMLIFAWGAYGASLAAAGNCSDISILVAYVCLDMIFATVLFIWASLHLCCLNGCCEGC